MPTLSNVSRRYYFIHIGNIKYIKKNIFFTFLFVLKFIYRIYY